MDINSKVATFFERYPLRIYDQREILLRAGEPIGRIFYIIDGRVSQYDIAPNGSEVVINVFKPGAFFPMSSAINDIDNSYFFEASLKTRVRVAPKAEVLQFLLDNPDVMFDLLARVYRGVDGVLRRMAHLMGGDAKSRLMFELLNATYRFGESQPDGSVLLKVHEGDLAKHAGLSRETVSRLLQDLKVAGHIEVTHGSMVVRDVKYIEDALGASL